MGWGQEGGGGLWGGVGWGHEWGGGGLKGRWRSIKMERMERTEGRWEDASQVLKN